MLRFLEGKGSENILICNWKRSQTGYILTIFGSKNPKKILK